MQTTRNRLMLLVSALSLLVAQACSDDASPGGGNGDTGGDSDAATDTAPDADDDTLPGDGGGDQGGDQGGDAVADQGGDQGGDDQGGDMVADQGDDQGGGDTGNDPVVDINDDGGGGGECTINQDGLTYPDNLTDGGENTRPVRLVIDAVDFERNIFRLRNVGDEAVDFDADWRVNINGATADALTSAPTIAAGDFLLVRYQSGTSDAHNLYLGSAQRDLYVCGGEIVIQYDVNAEIGGWSNRPSNVEAFIRWGSRPAAADSATFNDESFDAGAWAYDRTDSDSPIQNCWQEFTPDYNTFCAIRGNAPCEADDAGIIATGDATDPAGWVAMDSEAAAACL